MDAELKELFKLSDARMTRMEENLAKSTARFEAQMAQSAADWEERNKAFDAQHKRTEEAIESLAQTVSKYVTASDARMGRIEENLDGLIRAITHEHGNGKPK